MLEMDNSAIVLNLAGGDRAEIRLAGGELVAWHVSGANMLWTTQPTIWARTSPILFPIVGWIRNGEVSIDGRKYPMGVHGFAAASCFVPVARTDDSVSLRLTDDPATRAVFPFAFQLDVTYRLAAGRLAATFNVKNTGDAPLPYALGWHPGFAWPFSTGRRDQYAIAFARPERPEVPVITSDGLFSGRRRPIPLIGQRLPLSEELMAGEALCFLEAHSQGLRFIAPDGAAIRLELQDFPHIALWSRPRGSFLCIEAWTGHGDPEGFTGDIREKPSMRLLPAGAEAEHAVRLACEAAPRPIRRMT
jgi:galactose mutarotase-like enzyme